MAGQKPPSASVCLYVTGCAGAVAYIGGLVSAQCHQEAWMIAALSTSVLLLAGVTAILAAGWWISSPRRQARQMVRRIETWMKEEAARDDGRRPG